MPSKRTSTSTLLLTSLLLAALLFVFLYFSSSFHPYLIYLASLGLITFSLFGIDKLQAIRGGSRIPEVVLHGMSLLGGFIGGWFGMLLFRHKIRHARFWLVLIGSTSLHALLYYYGYIQRIFDSLGM